MVFKKIPQSSRRKKANINKEAIEHIKDTKRRIKEKIPQAKTKKKEK